MSERSSVKVFKSLKCLVFVALFAAMMMSSVCAFASDEMRTLWVERWDVIKPEACQTIVDAAKRYNFNCIVVQVRGRGDAFYNSHFEPRAENLENEPADYDPLGTILKEAHKAGIQVYAWLNVNYIWGSDDKPKSPDHIVNAHPEWLMRNKDNQVVMKSNDNYDGCFCCPSHRAYVDHLKDVFVDVVKNYPVDGICLDFIRYPGSDFCYCDWCLSRFKAEMDKKIKPAEAAELAKSSDRLAYVNAYPKDWNEYRREQITNIVYTLHDAMKAVRPEVKVSASVFPRTQDAADARFQDWRRWLKDKKLDLIYLMTYMKSTDSYAACIKTAMDASGGIPVCANIGSYYLPVDSTIEKIYKARELGAAGEGIYAWAVTKDGTDFSYLDTICKKTYQKPVGFYNFGK